MPRPPLARFALAAALLGTLALLPRPALADDGLGPNLGMEPPTDADAPVPASSACGGKGNRCDDGQPCTYGWQCKSRVCANNVCAGPSCSDGRRNQDEIDVDCGGQ